MVIPYVLEKFLAVTIFNFHISNFGNIYKILKNIVGLESSVYILRRHQNIYLLLILKRMPWHQSLKTPGNSLLVSTTRRVAAID